MTDLREYLRLKRDAVAALLARVVKPGYEPRPLRAKVTVEGRSGVRRVRLRHHQVLADSPPDFLGYDLGPSSPELALGALGGCLAHSWLIHAARLGVPLDAVEIEVTGQIDQRAGEPGHEGTPREPTGIAYVAHIVSPASEADLARVHEAVERLCPILNLIRNPQPVAGAFARAREEVPA